jgi:hypothetical protein
MASHHNGKQSVLLNTWRMSSVRAFMAVEAAAMDDEDDRDAAVVALAVVKVTGMSSVATKELALVATAVAPAIMAVVASALGKQRPCRGCRVVMEVVSGEAARIKKLVSAESST